MQDVVTLTDEELVKLSVTDTVYFGELIKRYEKILLRYVFRRSRATKEDAEDIVQNSFIKMYRNLNDFDTKLRFSSWAYRITHNETIDWYRKQKTRPLLVVAPEDEDIYATIASDVDIVSDAIKRDTKQEIEGIVKTLDQKYQEIILLKFFEDKSYEEIADILQIPPGTVAIRLSRAKKILRERLQKFLP